VQPQRKRSYPKEGLLTYADSRQVVKSLLSTMKDMFKKCTRGTRERAWDKLCSDRGKKEVKRLINNPSINLNHFDDFLTFKEWLNEVTMNNWVPGGVFALLTRPPRGFDFSWTPGLENYMKTVRKDLMRCRELPPGGWDQQPTPDGMTIVYVRKQEMENDEAGRPKKVQIYTKVPSGTNVNSVVQQLLTLQPTEHGPDPNLRLGQQAGPQVQTPTGAQQTTAQQQTPTGAQQTTAQQQSGVRPSVTTAQRPAAPVSVSCPRCGRPVPPGVNGRRHCMICGLDFNDKTAKVA